MNDWLVYLLRCSDNSLYCGVTLDLDRRVTLHNTGKASKYTRTRLPVEVAAVKTDLSKKDAFRLEYRVKRLPAHKKIDALTSETC